MSLSEHCLVHHIHVFHCADSDTDRLLVCCKTHTPREVPPHQAERNRLYEYRGLQDVLSRLPDLRTTKAGNAATEKW